VDKTKAVAPDRCMSECFDGRRECVCAVHRLPPSNVHGITEDHINMFTIGENVKFLMYRLGPGYLI
jgi:hypothetical protein